MSCSNSSLNPYNSSQNIQEINAELEKAVESRKIGCASGRLYLVIDTKSSKLLAVNKEDTNKFCKMNVDALAKAIYHFYERSVAPGKSIEEKSLETANGINLFKENFSKTVENCEPESYEFFKSLIHQITPLDTSASLTSSRLQRSQTPVTTLALRSQAAAFEASRNTQILAQKQETITPLGNSANKVYSVPFEDNIVPKVAYFKEGKAIATMENLMWNLAVLLGMEHLFVPTKATEIRTQSDLRDGDLTVKMLNENGELISITNAKPAKVGSVQPAQAGIPLEDYLKQQNTGSFSDVKEIPRNQLIDGTLAILLFGMFDAHSGNILVDKEGDLKFFDNTRSMPHSNGIIFYKGGLYSSLRSSLLKVNGSDKELTVSERLLMQQKVVDTKNKLKLIANQLKSAEKELPNHWLETQNALNAMVERIDNMLIALENPKIKTLTDFTFASAPDFKFFTVLRQLNQVIAFGNEPNMQTLHAESNSLGYFPLDTLLMQTAELGIDPREVEKLCSDSTQSFQMIMEQLKNLYKQKNASASAKDIALQGAVQMEKDYAKRAHFDAKDILQEEIKNNYSYYLAYKYFHSFDFPIFENPPQIFPQRCAYVWRDESHNPANLIYRYKNDKGEVVESSIDYKTSPGKIIINGQLGKPLDLYTGLPNSQFFRSNLNKEEADIKVREMSKEKGLVYSSLNSHSYFIATIKQNGEDQEVEHEQFDFDQETKEFISKTGKKITLEELSKRFTQC